MPIASIILDSITQLPKDTRGAIVLAASHAGTYSGAYAAAARLGGVILHDASFGRDEAGVAGLSILEKSGIPAAAIGHLSARIGDGADCYANGVITAVNSFAAFGGLKLGAAAQDALDVLSRCPSSTGGVQDEACLAENRVRWQGAPDGVPIWLVDSNSLVGPGDKGAIVITGSHGGLLGGRPETAIKAQAFAAVYNDAGVGKDNAGISRLSVLEANGIAGVTVDAMSARIGVAASTIEDGIVSHFNETARRFGAIRDQSMKELARLFAQAWQAANATRSVG